MNCKKEDYTIYKSDKYLFDSIQNKKIFIYNSNEFLKRIKLESDTVYVYNFFTTYNKKSLQTSRKIDSFLQFNKQKIKLIHTSLDFLSGAKNNLSNFKHSENSELILIYEPNKYKWYKVLNENWDNLPNSILITYKDSMKLVKSNEIGLSERYFMQQKDFLKNE